MRDGKTESAEGKTRRAQQLDDVADAGGKARQLGDPVAVLLHRRAAARRVGDDEIEVVGKRDGERASAGVGGVRSAGVKLQGAAAPLGPRYHDLEARQREETGRVAVHARVEVALNASAE